MPQPRRSFPRRRATSRPAKPHQRGQDRHRRGAGERLRASQHPAEGDFVSDAHRLEGRQSAEEPGAGVQRFAAQQLERDERNAAILADQSAMKGTLSVPI